MTLCERSSKEFMRKGTKTMFYTLLPKKSGLPGKLANSNSGLGKTKVRWKHLLVPKAEKTLKTHGSMS